MIQGIEITIWSEDGQSVEFDLSPEQFKAVKKILGLDFINGELKCFSDESVKAICKSTIDNLKRL